MRKLEERITMRSGCGATSVKQKRQKGWFNLLTIIIETDMNLAII